MKVTKRILRHYVLLAGIPKAKIFTGHYATDEAETLPLLAEFAFLSEMM